MEQHAFSLPYSFLSEIYDFLINPQTDLLEYEDTIFQVWNISDLHKQFLLNTLHLIKSKQFSRFHSADEIMSKLVQKLEPKYSHVSIPILNPKILKKSRFV